MALTRPSSRSSSKTLQPSCRHYQHTGSCCTCEAPVFVWHIRLAGLVDGSLEDKQCHEVAEAPFRVWHR